jgi:hypothetical protein
MATISNVSLVIGTQTIATAATGEIAPPPAANLTITNAGWYVRDQLDYLQRVCEVRATAAGQPWKGTFKITGITLPGLIKLTAN